MGIKLVFVMEGEAPKIKAETMSKRAGMAFRGGKMSKSVQKPAKATNTSRGRFKAVLREVVCVCLYGVRVKYFNRVFMAGNFTNCTASLSCMYFFFMGSAFLVVILYIQYTELFFQLS